MKTAWNSKIIVFALIVALLVSLALAGCQQTPAQPTDPQGSTDASKPEDPKPTETTLPAEEPFEVYWNLDKLTYMPKDNTDDVSSRKAEADGTYSVNFVYKGKVVAKKVKGDAELINKIDSLYVIGELIVDASDVVTGIQTVEEVGGSIVYADHYVFKYSGSNITVNPKDDFSSKAEKLKIEYNTYILDVTSEKVANLYELFKGDQVTAVANKKGEITHVFMYAPSELRVGRVAYCEHCQQEVQWSAWTNNEEFPVSTSGHIYLYEDITLTRQQSMSANVQLILDLNGKAIRRTTGKEEDTTGRVISLHNPGCYLALLDTSEEKTGVISSYGEIGALGGVVWIRDGQFDMYGGTLDGSQATNSSRGATVHVSTDKLFNMYGGTIIGGVTQAKLGEEGKYSGGGWGGSVFTDGTFNMHGGVIKNGVAKSTEIDGVVSRGIGGNVGVGAKGVFNMYGGEIYDGTADNGDAELYIAEGGVFTQTGGKIGKDAQ